MNSRNIQKKSNKEREDYKEEIVKWNDVERKRKKEDLRDRGRESEWGRWGRMGDWGRKFTW